MPLQFVEVFLAAALVFRQPATGDALMLRHWGQRVGGLVIKRGEVRVNEDGVLSAA